MASTKRATKVAPAEAAAGNLPAKTTKARRVFGGGDTMPMATSQAAAAVVLPLPVLPPPSILSPLPPLPPAPIALPPPMTTETLSDRAAKKRLSKVQKGMLNLRAELWPGITESDLWLRTKSVGFTTVPRTMPLFMELIADVSKRVSAGGKSVPAGKAYFVLWCRVFDEAVVKIEVEAAAATEAGYVGERNITTWREHLRVLQELGFIDVKPGMAGPYQFILLRNPYHAAKKLRDKGWVQDMTWMALFQRAQEIGATDLTA